HDGVVRNAAPWGTEVAYVRRDSFWIEREGGPDGEGGVAAQSTAPIFVEVDIDLDDLNGGIARHEPASDGPGIADEPELPSRWGRLSAPGVLALTGVAFALGIAVSPLVRSPSPPAPQTASAIPAPPAAPVLPAVPVPPALAPAACAFNGTDGATTAAPTPPVAHASARTAARNRSPSGLGATWSARPSPKKAPPEESRSQAAPDTARDDAGKASDQPHELAPGKAKESPAQKKPTAKAWVDPWA